MIARTILTTVIAGLGLACASPAGPPTADAAAELFEIAPGGKSQLVRFDSKAPAESFGGTTHTVRGTVRVDPTAIGDSLDVWVEVDLASLDTGIGMRNQHMRENHLHTDRFPVATFRGGKVTKLSKPSLAPGETATFDIAGTFDLHGVARAITVPVEMTLEAGEPAALHVVTRFKVKLSDHQIPRPQFLVMKLDEVQAITFDVRAQPRTSGEENSSGR